MSDTREAYMVVLEGMGDVRASLVDRETWDSINNGWWGDNERALSLKDSECLWQYSYKDDGEPEDLAQAWAAEHGYTIMETYEGYIY